ncbi:MAG: type I asparaginase [Bacteroidales bacterium]|jgi:L-asparaginase|nr:type I asparaginase [Bacteroidales bacterium]
MTINDNNSRVLLIYTGGTIGMCRNSSTGTLQPFDFSQFSACIPELEHLNIKIDVHTFDPPIDSCDMTPQMWISLVSVIAKVYDDYDGFVILHGTDTMAYTASALSFMFENLTKPIILTGSQLPIGQSRTDGKENIITSVEIAAAKRPDGQAIVPEVCVYFNWKLLRGNRAVKHSSDEFNAFKSFNFPSLANAGVELVYHEANIRRPDPTKPMIPHMSIDNNVVIFSIFPGIREDIIRHVLTTPDLKGVVMRTFGSGNAPQLPWLKEAIAEATSSGKVIVNVSQCMQGCVEMSRYTTGYQLKEAGVVSGHNMTVECAVTKLMCLLSQYSDADTVRKLMTQDLRGELSEQTL